MFRGFLAKVRVGNTFRIFLTQMKGRGMSLSWNIEFLRSSEDMFLIQRRYIKTYHSATPLIWCLNQFLPYRIKKKLHIMLTVYSMLLSKEA